MHRPETHVLSFLRCLRQCPCGRLQTLFAVMTLADITCRQLTKTQVLQVMLNITGSRQAALPLLSCRAMLFNYPMLFSHTVPFRHKKPSTRLICSYHFNSGHLTSAC